MGTSLAKDARALQRQISTLHADSEATLITYSKLLHKYPEDRRALLGLLDATAHSIIEGWRLRALDDHTNARGAFNSLEKGRWEAFGWLELDIAFASVWIDKPTFLIQLRALHDKTKLNWKTAVGLIATAKGNARDVKPKHIKHVLEEAQATERSVTVAHRKTAVHGDQREVYGPATGDWEEQESNAEQDEDGDVTLVEHDPPTQKSPDQPPITQSDPPSWGEDDTCLDDGIVPVNETGRQHLQRQHLDEQRIEPEQLDQTRLATMATSNGQSVQPEDRVAIVKRWKQELEDSRAKARESREANVAAGVHLEETTNTSNLNARKRVARVAFGIPDDEGQVGGEAAGKVLAVATAELERTATAWKADREETARKEAEFVEITRVVLEGV
ncbi:uncharacterized protein J4E78_010651 [Alternaria triticimaculans]|uniref:uncharacterized protein n=1 Tax=Alternaria triticimaculans TaxID=297637 RepID=UPI0020C54481|nr:uncharacterized protein J4E78_010651 [Alternaria triticimaculans]KAI4640527.1 hypothetical protein J4E78_010651 [Alternaria triticimaculans]